MVQRVAAAVMTVVVRGLFLIAFLLTWSVAEDIVGAIAMDRPDANASLLSSLGMPVGGN